MAVKQKIFIPTFISSVDYQPVRTLPHIYFYNGLKDCEPYYIQHYATGSGSGVVSTQIEQFPYFDNYDGLIPTTGSNSLLFFNETSVYGDTPTASLYTEYWDKYVTLLYNPVTRLLNASAIIPLADYFDMELNDIVQWRGNYYHLRAINDYNLKDGTCNIQLLGPIIPDATSPITFDCNFNFSSSIETAIPTTTIPVSTTTIGPMAYQYFINYAQDGGANNNSTACGPTTLYSVWSTKSSINSITNGDVLYSNAGLSTVWNGNLEWYGINTAYGLSPSITLQITNAGVVATTGVCSVPTTSTTTQIFTTSTTTQPDVTSTTTQINPTSTTTLSNIAVYTVIEGGEVSGGDYIYIDQNFNTITGSLGVDERIFVGTISGSVDITGVGSGIYYSSTEYGTTFEAQTSGCRTYKFENKSYGYSNADVVAFYVPCGGTSLTYGWINATNDPDDFIERCISYTGSAELAGSLPDLRQMTDIGAC